MEEPELLKLLAEGELEIQGRIAGASNATLYAAVSLDGVATGCVYKPISGEKPLWDFPSRTLGLRETASYVLSAHTGLDVVPPTVLREGPFGPGSVQLWINAPADHEPATGLGGLPLAVEPVMGEPGAGVVDVVAPEALPQDWKRVLVAEDAAGDPVVLAHADDPGLRRIALFDAVANNTDRKGGHILRGTDGRLYGVDHGLTFNLDDKLRTVLWGWAGERLGEEACELLDALVTDLTGDGELRTVLAGLLEGDEIDRTARRAAQLLRRGRFPKPPGDWAAIPWPPF
ncbi:SCO1664 family protein [Kineosporia rhizophila]|uniref:SCO1664 family protein n=1 Tax=Kineosporia TaxID=49184 RepID=UPI001E5D5195|nr:MULTISPECIES: SCO1664 family protein [Kineosporia]MCE0538442.1 SCO1664 family protein [Kineosporia rhizophila]GLY18295.1 phosphatidylinositol kinase [Kineosporia sp. NBRC 101677]